MKIGSESRIVIESRAEADADILHAAMENAGTDEDAISKLLTHRTNAERQRIAVAYKAKYDKDLIDELKHELSGNFEKVIIALMTKPDEYLAQELHKSVKGPGTNEETLVEIVASMDNAQKKDVKRAYQRLYEKNLVEDIDEDTSGFFRQFLTALLADVRNDIDRPEETVEKLLTGDEHDWGNVLSTNTFLSLKRIFSSFEKLSSKKVEDAIKEQFHGDVELAFLTVAKCAQNTPAYFAERLRESMKGAGTDEATLIRIIVSRSEIDLNKIQIEYRQLYDRNLKDDIENDTSGHFEDTLVYLVEGIQV